MTELRQNYRVGDLNLDEVNRVFAQVADRLDQMEGFRGTPNFKADVDMGGYKATNAGDALASGDLTPLGQVISLIYPVGSIFLSVLSTNPETLLGVGTWTQIATGKMLVGYSSGDSDFGTVEASGGSKTKNLAHTHGMKSHTHAIDHIHGTVANAGAVAGGHDATFAGASGVPSDNTSESGGSATQDVLNPFYVVYVWKRTA